MQSGRSFYIYIRKGLEIFIKTVALNFNKFCSISQLSDLYSLNMGRPARQGRGEQFGGGANRIFKLKGSGNKNVNFIVLFERGCKTI